MAEVCSLAVDGLTMNCAILTLFGLLTLNLSWVNALTASSPVNLLRSQTYDHTVNGINQRTVYLRGIPVISFAGEWAVANAERFLALVEQAATQNLPADQIQVLAESGQLAIRFGELGLWQVDDSMTFPDSKGDRMQDVQMIANRLRRAFGGTVPVAPTVDNQLVTQVIRVVQVLTGMASWYGPGLHGRPSASGEIFNQHALTAAHPTLPFGTTVRITNLVNGLSVIVRINDRGPFMRDRVIDLSRAAAQRIGLIRLGVAPVKLEVLANPQ
ncbi:MAG: septal ring lytic transglycosylase RlpA family protein [Pseudanabaenaceae cyanobacterium]